MYRLLLALILIPVLALPAHAAKHALLIGIADYRRSSGFANLDGTINDVELVQGMLKERFGFKEGEVRVLKDSEATHDGIQRAFARLAGQVGKDDLVYIHFSGHGSRTPNLNGRKKPKYAGGVAYDSTWVSYGSRAKPEAASPQQGDPIDLNAFDILNEEVGEWLEPIYAKTDNIAFVSDSCHSGNMTRGEAPKVRAIDVDLRPHPLGKREFKHSAASGVVVGAAREDQQAGEYLAPDGNPYGLFTWNWVQALYQSLPGDTWDDAFKRTVALMGNVRESRQHPQIEGKVKRAVFGGDFPAPVQSVPVSEVSMDGRTLSIKAGRFVGVTLGSTYKKKGGEDTFVITAVNPFSSEGEATKGTFAKGDLAVEETHVYPYTPIKVLVRADLDADRALAETLRATVAGLPGYQAAASQQEADLLLLVIRPKRQGGALVKAKPEATLPLPDPAAKPEVWVLAPDEQPTREKLQLQPDSAKRATDLVAENLKKMSRIRELEKLGTAAGGGSPLVELLVTHYTRDPRCRGESCLEVPDEKATGLFRPLGSYPAHQLQGSRIKRGDILTFAVKNQSNSDLYCYLVDLTPKGRIEAVYPKPEESADAVLVPSGKERNFGDVAGLLVEEPGEDTVKLIVSQMPLDVALFEQGTFRMRGERRGGVNPLEDFLSGALQGGTRGFISTSAKKTQWGTVQFTFQGE